MLVDNIVPVTVDWLGPCPDTVGLVNEYAVPGLPVYETVSAAGRVFTPYI